MKKLINYLILLSLSFVYCSCGNTKVHPSGNPSEILETETYNKLQQKYKTIRNFQKGTAIVKIDKYGLIDYNGKEILSCEYDTIYGLKNSFRIIVKDSLYGATDIDGNIIKQCVYSGAYDAECKFLALQLNDKWGFIDTLGNDITQYKYEKIYNYNDSVFVAKYNGYFGLCDYTQSILIPFEYDEILYKLDEKSPVTIVKSGEFYGLYNSQNKKVLECEYDLMLPDSSGLMTIKKDAQSYRDVRYALVEAETGKVIIPFEYMDMGHYSEGLVAAENLEGKWGYLDEKGSTILPFIYEEAGDFHEGLAAVYKKSGEFMNTIGFGRVEKLKCGYIDKTGKIVIPFKFQQCSTIGINEFHDGLAVQGFSNNNIFALVFGYIDKTGSWVIRPKFDEAKQFNNGIAQVVINDKYGYINTKGDQIIPCEYDKYGGWFVNDSTIKIEKEGVGYYFNLQGKPVIEPE